MSGPVALIGFMGAGKTRVGRLTARRLGWAFVDTDAVIVARSGPIDEIFARRGEAGFREIERDVALAELDVALGPDRVVSLGGGSVTIPEVRERLQGLKNVVWLDAPVELLFSRARRRSRPLARDEATFRRLYAERRPEYAALATLTVLASDTEPPTALARRIAAGVEAA